MRKKKINAFTLVELLAVIVILAIILIIAVPKITKVIEQSKKGALESSGKLIAGSLETKYKETLMLGTDDISTSTSKICPDSMYNSNLYSCTYTLDSDTGKSKVTLLGEEESKFKGLGVTATTTEAYVYTLGTTIVIKYNGQGGGTGGQKKLTAGEKYGYLQPATKSNYVFDGWYTEATGGERVTSTDIAYKSITLYAHYKEAYELSSSWSTTVAGKTVDSLTVSLTNIKKIKFYSNGEYDTTGKTFIANVSTTGETIKAYGVVDSTDSTKVDIDIVADKIISFPFESYKLFADLNYLETLDFNNSITTANVSYMRLMFYHCFKLTSIDVSNFDTSSVVTMSQMFSACHSLTNLDLSNFSTATTYDMSGMFEFCFSLNVIDVSGFDTSNVTNMSSMFRMVGPNNLEYVDGVSYSGRGNAVNYLTKIIGLENFDTKKVTNMSYLFSGCYNLESLNISSFDASNVTNMSYMFASVGYNSTSFTLDVSNLNTSKVVDMTDMFSETGYSSKIFTLDVSNFNTSKVTKMSSMFASTGYSSAVFTLDVSNFNTSKVTIMYGMFSNTGHDSEAFELNGLNKFDTSNVTNMTYMFLGTGYKSKVFTLDVSGFNTSKVTTMYGMFECTGHDSEVFTLDVSKFDTSNVTNMFHMFMETGHNSKKFNTEITILNPNVTNYNDMFIDAASTSGSQIIINYTADTETLANNMLSTKGSGNVILASNPKEVIIPNITTENITTSGSGYANSLMTLVSTNENLVVKSFKLNGTLVNGRTFQMPSTPPTISDVKTVEIYVVESSHEPYENDLNTVIYGEKTYEGATSLTVTLDCQTEGIAYDFVTLYGANNSTRYGGTTRRTSIVEIPGNYIKVVFTSNSSGNNYYGFKATVVPNYK